MCLKALQFSVSFFKIYLTNCVVYHHVRSSIENKYKNSIKFKDYVYVCLKGFIRCILIFLFHSPFYSADIIFLKENEAYEKKSFLAYGNIILNLFMSSCVFSNNR